MKTCLIKPAVAMLAFAASCNLFAISGESAPITGSAVIDGDLHIAYTPGSIYNDSWGINAGAGAVVTSSGSPSVTIDILATESSAAWGLWAHDGGKIDLGGSVFVNGGDYGSVGVLVYDALSEISIGNGSEIYAGNNGTAVGVVGGSATIGDNATLWGKVWGGEDGAVFVKNGGTVTVGNNATIVNDTTGTEFQYLHFALTSMGGGTINVGDDAKIRLLGTTSYNSGAIRASGNINIGDRAEITSEGSSYGIYADTAGIEVKVGQNAKISTVGKDAVAVVLTGGAAVSLEEGAEIVTTGAEAHAVAVQRVGSKFTAKDGLVVEARGTDSAAIMATNGGIAEIMGATISSVDSYALYAASNDSANISKIIVRGRQNMAGNIHAAANGSVDVASADGSRIEGTAIVEEDGVLDFDMTGTEWIMTGASTVSNISIKADSTIVQTISGADSFTSLTADVFSIEDSVIKVILKDYTAAAGDEFQLVVSDNMTLSGSFEFDFGEATLAEGLFWETGDFATTGYIRVGGEIPEPAAYAMVFGALALALAAYTKNRK